MSFLSGAQCNKLNGDRDPFNPRFVLFVEVLMVGTTVFSRAPRSVPGSFAFHEKTDAGEVAGG